MSKEKVIRVIISNTLKAHPAAGDTLEFLKKRLLFFLPNYNFIFSEECNVCPEDEVIMFWSARAPLLDHSLIIRALELLKRRGAGKVFFDDAIPGTSPEFLSYGSGEKYLIHSGTQSLWGTTFCVDRGKRAKVFSSFCSKYHDFHTWKLDTICNFFATAQGISDVLEYGEDIKLEYVTECPSCHSPDFSPVYTSSGHPVIGFLNRKSEYYFRCSDCSLVFLNPLPAKDSLKLYYDIFETGRDYSIINRPFPTYDNCSHYENYLRATEIIGNLRNNKNVLDLGGGGGDFLRLLRSVFKDTYMHVHDFNITNRQDLDSSFITYSEGDLIENSPRIKVGWDVVTMWEVMEHLHPKDIEGVFKSIHDMLSVDGSFIFSTPDFDNPICRSIDFWAMSPGSHLTVLSERFLKPIWEKAGFVLEATKHEFVTLKNCGGWWKYSSENGGGMGAQGDASIIELILSHEKMRNELQSELRKLEMGSEVIFHLKRKD